MPLESAERFFHYMLNAGIDKPAFERRVQQINSVEILHRAMTLADQYRQEGLEQGLERGMERGLEQGIERGETRAQRRTLLEVLTTRFDTLPEGLREHLEQLSDRDQLTALLKTAVLCASLEDFVSSL